MSSTSGSGRSSRSSSTRRLLGFADEAIREVAGTSHKLPSGPLHDAAEVSRAGVPTVMIFVQSPHGLSHTKLEDTKPEHLELAVQALDRLADKRIAQVASACAQRPRRPPPSSSTATASCSRRELVARRGRVFARYDKVFGDDDKRVLIGTSAPAGSRVLERLLDQPGRAERLGLELLVSSSGGCSRRRQPFRVPRSSCGAGMTEAGRGGLEHAQRLVRGALACAGLSQYFDRGHGRPGARAEAVARRLPPGLRAARRGSSSARSGLRIHRPASRPPAPPACS